jgi:hypothetical protein
MERIDAIMRRRMARNELEKRQREGERERGFQVQMSREV